MMVLMNISLPELLRDHVQRRAVERGFANASDFVQALIREDCEREAKAEIELLLLEGMRSGEAEEATGAYWRALKAEFSETVPSA